MATNEHCLLFGKVKKDFSCFENCSQLENFFEGCFNFQAIILGSLDPYAHAYF